MFTITKYQTFLHPVYQKFLNVLDQLFRWITVTATPFKNNFLCELFYNCCDKIPKEEDFREESVFGFVCFCLFSVLQIVDIIGEILEGEATWQLREKELAQAIRSHCQPSVTGSSSKALLLNSLQHSLTSWRSNVQTLNLWRTVQFQTIEVQLRHSEPKDNLQSSQSSIMVGYEEQCIGYDDLINVSLF